MTPSLRNDGRERPRPQLSKFDALRELIPLISTSSETRTNIARNPRCDPPAIPLRASLYHFDPNVLNFPNTESACQYHKYRSVQLWQLLELEIEERCKGVHCVDLGESFPTSIYLQKSASIHPRTSPSKFGEKFNSLFTSLLNGVSTAPRPGHGSTGAIRIAQVPQRMADAFEIESFAKGYQILDYGASQDKFYIVSKGSVDLRSDTSSGNRRSVQGYVFSNSESERILF